MEFEDLDFDHFDVSAALRHSVCHLGSQGGTNMKRAKTSCWCRTDQCASVPIMHQWGKPTEASENQQSSEVGALIPVWLFAHSRYRIERLSLHAVLLYVYTATEIAAVRLLSDQTQSVKLLSFFFFFFA